MRILTITSELAPFAKTGGLGDAVSALASQLHQIGHEVRVFVPLYGGIDRQRAGLVAVDFLQDIALETGSFGLRYSVYTGPKSDGLWVYFIDCPILYARPGLYTSDADEHLRFVLLSRGAIECCQRMGWSPHIALCNDWQTGLVPLYLKSLYSWDGLFAQTRSVLSLHNIGYQGVFGSGVLNDTGLGHYQSRLHQDDLAKGQINFLKTGVMYADALVTVSPTYADEICTPAYGMGLDPYLRQRRENLHGILNGVDYDVWSPERDAFIPHAYSADNLSGKRRNKTSLQKQFGLTRDQDVPVVGIVSRLVKQKGFELAYRVLPQLLTEKRIQLAVLGNGEYRFEEFFSWLAHDFSDRAGFWRGFNNPLAHLIEAGSDMFLMPSLYEPCGLNQMYSLRYGTVPIVRKTGGLADTVIPHTSPGGNGIVFEHADENGVAWALDTATRLFADRKRWRGMMANGMQQDFSWDQQGRLYEELFVQLHSAGTAAQSAG